MKLVAKYSSTFWIFWTRSLKSLTLWVQTPPSPGWIKEVIYFLLVIEFPRQNKTWVQLLLLLLFLVSSVWLSRCSDYSLYVAPNSTEPNPPSAGLPAFIEPGVTRRLRYSSNTCLSVLQRIKMSLFSSVDQNQTARLSMRRRQSHCDRSHFTLWPLPYSPVRSCFFGIQ